MAKEPKKRTKKTSIVDIKRKEINSIVNLCYQGITFLGDCYHKPRCMNIQKLWTHLRGGYHEIGMDVFIKHLTRNMSWSLGVCCYFRNKDDSIDVVNIHAIFEDNFSMFEVSSELSNVIINCINLALEVDEKYKNNNFIYYSYVLVPEYHFETHSIRVDGLGDLMINLGDIDQFEPFGEDLPGIPSDEKTLTEAIINNGIFPRMKERHYVPIDILYYHYEDADGEIEYSKETEKVFENVCN